MNALVTGGSSGLGLAISLALLRSDYNVVATSRSIARLQAAFADAPLSGEERCRLHFVECDLSEDSGVALCVEKAMLALRSSSLSLLVNNAGSGVLAQYLAGPEEALMVAYDATMALDLRAPYRLTALCVPFLEASGHGNVINISSLAAVRPLAGLSAYCIAKAGVEMLTKCTAIELAPKRIRCNCIAPATIATSFHASAGMSLETAAAYYSGSAAVHPIGRVGSPADVAAMAMFLASSESSFCTGAVFTLDGGRTLTTATSSQLSASPAGAK
jgi:NAD(P)-dependent dehydrogenase (short-subunit alcohol dehydrogenase family)